MSMKPVIHALRQARTAARSVAGKLPSWARLQEAEERRRLRDAFKMEYVFDATGRPARIGPYGTRWGAIKGRRRWDARRGHAKARALSRAVGHRALYKRAKHGYSLDIRRVPGVFQNYWRDFAARKAPTLLAQLAIGWQQRHFEAVVTPALDEFLDWLPRPARADYEAGVVTMRVRVTADMGQEAWGD